jgi:hypothetical protein
MSCLNVVGLFSLANGRHEQISTSPAKSTTYVVYDSSLSCPDQSSTDVQIRHFSSTGSILPNDTVALVIGKLAFPSSPSALAVIVTMQFFDFPGDALLRKI